MSGAHRFCGRRGGGRAGKTRKAGREIQVFFLGAGLAAIFESQNASFRDGDPPCLSQDCSYPFAPDAFCGWIVGPVNEGRLAYDVLRLDESPEPAVGAVVPVVAQDKERPARDGHRAKLSRGATAAGRISGIRLAPGSFCRVFR